MKSKQEIQTTALFWWLELLLIIGIAGFHAIRLWTLLSEILKTLDSNLLVNTVVTMVLGISVYIVDGLLQALLNLAYSPNGLRNFQKNRKFPLLDFAISTPAKTWRSSIGLYGLLRFYQVLKLLISLLITIAIPMLPIDPFFKWTLSLLVMLLTLNSLLHLVPLKRSRSCYLLNLPSSQAGRDRFALHLRNLEMIQQGTEIESSEQDETINAFNYDQKLANFYQALTDLDFEKAQLEMAKLDTVDRYVGRKLGHELVSWRHFFKAILGSDDRAIVTSGGNSLHEINARLANLIFTQVDGLQAQQALRNLQQVLNKTSGPVITDMYKQLIHFYQSYIEKLVS